MGKSRNHSHRTNIFGVDWDVCGEYQKNKKMTNREIERQRKMEEIEKAFIDESRPIRPVVKEK